MGLEGSYSDQEFEDKKLETPEEVIEISEQMLQKAALEGREDYSLVILDAVYEAYKRNLDVLENLTQEERSSWETEALYTTYPRAYLIWDEVQGSKLNPEKREVAKIIAERAIEVENEQAERIKNGEQELRYDKAYRQKIDWINNISSKLFPDSKEFENKLIDGAVAIVNEIGKGKWRMIYEQISKYIFEEINALANKVSPFVEEVQKDLLFLYHDMRKKLTRELEENRYFEKSAYKDCDNSSRYAAVGIGSALGSVRNLRPTINLHSIYREVLKRSPDFMQAIASDDSPILKGAREEAERKLIANVGQGAVILINAYHEVSGGEENK